MMIFDISHSKSGTTSLAQALRVLGFRTCHGCPPQYEEDLVAKLLVNSTHFDLLNEFDAVSDLLNFAYRQLDRDHPDAKFIYLNRDDDAWVQSSVRHLTERRNMSAQTNVRINAITLGRLMNIGCLHSTDLRYLVYQRARRRKEVFDYFSGPRSDKLLVMQITDGWEPLCRFLDCPVPTTPFPVLNVSNRS